MTDAPASGILRLVGRARSRLEALRIAKACARGALAGGAAGVGLMLVGRFAPALRVGPLVPWIVLLAAALGAALGALWFGRRIRAEDAALFLDDRLGTRGGIVTLLEMPAHPFAERFAAGADARALPRLPFPREISLVPVALFLLFGVGLLPAAAAAKETSATSAVSIPADAVPGIDAPPAELARIDPLLAELRKGTSLSAQSDELIRNHIDRRLHLPEERHEARKELERARAGDATAAESLERRLGETSAGPGNGAAGGTSRQNPKAGSAHPEIERTKRGGASSPYPEAVDLVRAYHSALATRGQ